MSKFFRLSGSFWYIEVQDSWSGGLRGPQTSSSLSLLLRQTKTQNVIRLKSSQIWDAQVGPELKLFELIFQDSQLDPDVRNLLMVQIEQLRDWNSAGDPRNSRQFALSELANRNACACLVIRCREDVEHAEGLALHLVGSAAGAMRFYRAALDLGDFSEEQFIANSVLGFPNLKLHADLANQFGRFSIPYRTIRSSVISGLADLNDILYPMQIETFDPIEVARQFDARSQYSISPDSPSTHRNRAAMRLRDVMFGSERVKCEWHLKIRPDRDRIHFSFGKAGLERGRILVGIFHRHLPT